MAITDLKTGETSHVGRVVGTHVARGVRIMSDVWADLHYVVVYEPTREATGVDSTRNQWCSETKSYNEGPMGPCGFFRMIQVQNTEFPHSAGEGFEFEVDGSEEAMAAYEGWKAGQALQGALNRYDSEQYQLLERRRFVDRDKWVRVVSGRKVKIGTEGKVFWLKDESYYGQRSTKIGIALPQPDGTFRMERRPGRNGQVFESYADVAWTYAKNVKVISGPQGRIL